MLDLTRIERQILATDPYDWAFVDGLFAPADAEALATTYPRDHFKTVKGYDGEKGYEYEARSLIAMGASVPSYVEGLSPAWQQLARALLSRDYRGVMTKLTGCNLLGATIEVNVFHYTPGSWLGPHLDLKDKLVTHVLYFNQSWNTADGGCLTILRSSDMADVVAEVAPIIGNSSVLVRSEKSWHAVSRVVDGCRRSRRSVTVTFYRPGALSTMWPAGDGTPLHDYTNAE
jgi:SM-20-related protein